MYSSKDKELKFRKSSYSSSNIECVEVADLPGGAAVRDSKNPEKGHWSPPLPSGLGCSVRCELANCKRVR